MGVWAQVLRLAQWRSPLQSVSGSARRVCGAVVINLAILILSVIQAVAVPADQRVSDDPDPL
jgi:hypothetical protein